MNLKEAGHKNVRILGTSSFFNDVGSEMVVPILPFYITALGGGGIAIGLISGLKEGFSSLFKLFGGYFSDRYGKRKEIIFFGYFVSVIFKFLLGVAGSWQQLVAFVSIERFGKLRDAPRDTIIAESSRHRGKWFGIHKTMDTAGAVVGSFLVLFLFWKFALDYRTIIFIAAGFSFFSLIIIKLLNAKKIKTTKKTVSYGISHLSKKLKYFIFVIGIFTLANFGMYMFMILKAQEVSGNMIFPLAMYGVMNLVFSGLAIPFGKLSDRFGRKSVLMLGYILFFFVCIGFVYFSSLFAIGFLFALYGLVLAITEANQKAFVADLSGNMKGTAHGFYYLVIGLAGIFGGIIAGHMWTISPGTMFAYLAGMTFLAILFLNFLKR